LHSKTWVASSHSLKTIHKVHTILYPNDKLSECLVGIIPCCHLCLFFADSLRLYHLPSGV